MKRSLLTAVLLIGFVATGVRAQDSERWFVTGAPELLAANASLTPLMTWEDYAAMVAQLRAPRFVPLIEHPALSERARFAMNFVLGGKNRTLAIDGSPEQGYRLYLDIDGNGKLTDGSAAHDAGCRKFTASFHQDVTDTSGGSPETYPVEMTFTLDTAIRQAAPFRFRWCAGATLPCAAAWCTWRVSMCRSRFGRSGIYNGPSGEVVFDLRDAGLTSSTSGRRTDSGS
jgi:hypothetical protein